jgi:molybdopterin-guanine dinucleotide biosynthesis protein B
VIVEGYKSAPIPKVEVHRKLSGAPLLYIDDPHIVAVATDESLATQLPQFGLDDAEGVAHFVIRHLGLDRPRLGIVR